MLRLGHEDDYRQILHLSEEEEQTEWSEGKLQSGYRTENINNKIQDTRYIYMCIYIYIYIYIYISCSHNLRFLKSVSHKK